MPKCVVGSSIIITVLVTDNSNEFNNPNGTPTPTSVATMSITLTTPSGATPVSGQPMNPATTLGYYTYEYNSLTTDEVGQWFATIVATNGPATGSMRKQPIFFLI